MEGIEDMEDNGFLDFYLKNIYEFSEEQLKRAELSADYILKNKLEVDIPEPK